MEALVALAQRQYRREMRMGMEAYRLLGVWVEQLRATKLGRKATMSQMLNAKVVMDNRVPEGFVCVLCADELIPERYFEWDDWKVYYAYRDWVRNQPPWREVR